MPFSTTGLDWANLTVDAAATTAPHPYGVFGAIRAGAGAKEWCFTGEQPDPHGNRNFCYLRRLLEVFFGAALAHHFVEEVLYDHEEEEDLALLASGHAGEHVEELRVDLFRQGEAVLRDICH